MALQRVITAAAERQLKELIAEHAAKTGSAKAKAILADWDVSKEMFWMCVPPAEKNTPEVNPDLDQEVRAVFAVTLHI